MQYNEILARRIVAEVARSSIDGGALQPVMLHEVARRLKINEASVEAGMYRAVAERWLWARRRSAEPHARDSLRVQKRRAMR
jgi:hypothetical protein